MTTLKRKAQLALEGSDRSEAALAHVRDYLEDIGGRTLTVSDVELSVELGALLRLLRELADPVGSSAYKMQIVPRRATGRPPNPLGKRMRATDALIAALHADRLLQTESGMQKKAANSEAAERLGVAISEVHAARRTAIYRELREWNLERVKAQDTEK